MRHRNPNILIVCEHASDVFGGEAALPLHYFILLSNRFDNVFLLTHERVRSRLEAIPEIRTKNIYYMPDTCFHIFLHRIFAKLPDRIALVTVGAVMYFLTQFYQRAMAKKIILEKAIDIVHEPTPVSPKQPSVMFGLGVPVIIGPMNGGMDFPPAFSCLASNLEKLVYGLVRFSSNVFNILIPGKLFASMLLVANDRTRKALPALKLGSVVELVENGVLESKIIARSEINEKQKSCPCALCGQINRPKNGRYCNTSGEHL